MRTSRSLSAALVTAGLALAAVSVTADAQSPRGGYRGGPGETAWTTAHSRFGNGSISAPVRHGSRGLEVRLPGGTWIDCGRSCSNTLRTQTVDFWENQGGPQSKDNGPGYFRFNSWF